MLNLEKSKAFYNEAKKLAPAGVHSPVRAFGSVGGQPIFFKEGKGATIKDVDGNEYTDFCMSWGALSLGHAHPNVVSEITTQVQRGTHFGTPTELDVILAKIVTDLIKPMDHIRFVNSGTEAVMTAVRLARGITKKDKIVKIEGAYHGHLDSLLVSAGSGLVTQGQSSSEGVTQGTVQDTLSIPYDNQEALEKVFADFGDQIAGVIVEPVLANNGLFEHKKEYLQKLRSLCDSHNAKLIFDEVITGFRISKGGAQELYGITADIATYGKVIGGGMPIGAVAGRKEVMEHLAPTGKVYQAGTLSGNPVAMAAGIASMKVMLDDDFFTHTEEIGQYLDKRLTEACEKAKIDISFRRVKALFWLTPGSKTPPNASHEITSENAKVYAGLFHHFLNSGIYMAPSAYEVAFLSLCHQKEHIDKLAEAIESYDN